MSDERAFLKAIKKKPDDRTARLVYADWLQEQDDLRGELIRIEEELPTLAIYSDRYWELKPRRRELLRAAEKPWLKQMGYGSTDYQPVFADVPSGWKERWRLIREFVERWFQIPMDDVGGPLKPIPKNHPEWRFRKEYIHGVEAAFKKRKLIAGLPPSLREWMLFIRELRLRLENLTLANGDLDNFADSPQRIDFYQEECGRICYFIGKEDRHEPDPQVWEAEYDEPVCLAPHITTFALHRLLNHSQFLGPSAPQLTDFREPQQMTKAFARRLAKCFPVRSTFDELQMFERPNAIALWGPRSQLIGRDPVIRVWGRTPAEREAVEAELWG